MILCHKNVPGLEMVPKAGSKNVLEKSLPLGLTNSLCCNYFRIDMIFMEMGTLGHIL